MIHLMDGRAWSTANKQNGKRALSSLHVHMTFFVIGPRREKIYLRRFVNNTGADQPAHPRSLISAFVIRYLESIIHVNLLQVKFQYSS